MIRRLIARRLRKQRIMPRAWNTPRRPAWYARVFTRRVYP